MKLSVRTIIILSAVTLGAGVTGGVSRAAEEPEALTREAGKGTQATPETSGLFRIIGEALTEVEMRPDQKEAVQKLGEQVTTRQMSVDKARTAFVLSLADEIAAAHVDRSAIEPKIDALAAARQAESPVLRKALVSMHELFDAQQRDKFVDAIEKHLKGMREHKSIDTVVEKWSKDLELTDAQKPELHSLLEKAGQSETADRENVDKLFTAFRSDSFDPEKIEPEKEVGAKAKDRAMRLVNLASAVSAILTPEQRTKAATKIREAFGAAPKATAPIEHTRDGAGPDEDDIGTSPQELIVGGGFARGGAVGGWGYGATRGFGFSRGFGYTRAFSGGGMVF